MLCVKNTRNKKSGINPTNYGTVSQSDLPNGRRGKHHLMLVDVLEDLQKLADDRAIKIPLADLPSSVADIRSAVHRAARKQNVEIATSSDDEYFYVWKPGASSSH